MTAQQSQSALPTGTTPAALTPAATDTFADGQFGPNGLNLWVMTTGTATNVTVLDPTKSDMSNPATVTPVACPTTGTRLIPVPRTAIDPATGFASVTFSGALTGVTYYAIRV